MVANAADKKKCVCCESDRPADVPGAIGGGGGTSIGEGLGGAQPSSAGLAGFVGSVGSAPTGGAGGTGFKFPVVLKPPAGSSSEVGVGDVGAGSGVEAGPGKRRYDREEEEEEDTDDTSKSDAPAVKRRGMYSPSAHTHTHSLTHSLSLSLSHTHSLTHTHIGTGRVVALQQLSDPEQVRGESASEWTRGGETAVVPRVMGSPRLLGYSFLATDIEAATSFLQEVAGMQVRGHQDHFQSLEGGLGFDGRVDAADWSKTLLACPGATDLSLTLELVHVKTLAMHQIPADLTEVVLASTPTLRRLRQRRPEWEARGWVPLETMSGLVLRIPGTAVALKVVPSEEGRLSSGASNARPIMSEIVSVALPSLDLSAARDFYQQTLGMQVAASGQVSGEQVSLSFGTLGPRLVLVGCPPPSSPRPPFTPSRDGTAKSTKSDSFKHAIDYGNLGCSPPWRAGGVGGDGQEGGGGTRNDGRREGTVEWRGPGVPASVGRLMIGCTRGVLHSVAARATVERCVSLVPLSSFPGPRNIPLAFALFQSPDGHEVATVEKEALLTLLKPVNEAENHLKTALSALAAASASTTTTAFSASTSASMVPSARARAPASSSDSPSKTQETAPILKSPLYSELYA